MSNQLTEAAQGLTKFQQALIDAGRVELPTLSFRRMDKRLKTGTWVTTLACGDTEFMSYSHHGYLRCSREYDHGLQKVVEVRKL